VQEFQLECTWWGRTIDYQCMTIQCFSLSFETLRQPWSTMLLSSCDHKVREARGLAVQMQLEGVCNFNSQYGHPLSCFAFPVNYTFKRAKLYI